MDLKSLLGILKKQLDAENIDHALIGGLAVGGLGYQRFTNDIDLMVHEDDCVKLKALLTRQGYSIFSESAEFIQFQGPCPIDIQIARRPISKKMLSDAQFLPGLNVRCLVPEDIIGLKIQAYATNPKREFKEKADIQALAEILDQKLDWNRIKEYADLFGKWDDILFLRKKISNE